MSTDKVCDQCGKTFISKDTRARFCNHSCSAKYTNPLRRKEMPPCLCCGQPVKQRRNTYCSNLCSAKYRRDQRVFKIKQSGYVVGAPGTVRKFMLTEYPNQCVICKGELWMGKPIPLVVDHINGNPYDNRVINLRLICGNCDMQLSTYKGKNAGNGRAYRRERYAEGKSY